MKLHVVSSLVGGYAREDAPTATVVGAFQDPVVANAVKLAMGIGAQVHEIEVDHVPAGLQKTIDELGLLRRAQHKA